MKLATKVFAVAVAAAVLSTSAEASSVSSNYGQLNYNQLYSFGDLLTDGTSFTDTLQFNLTGLSDLTGIIAETGISGFTASITGGSLGSTGTPLTPDAFRLIDLSAGSYTMTFQGTAATSSNIFPGIYGTFFSAAAVPEPDTWLMMIIGAGLVAFQLRRKQKVLRHRPLVAS